MARRWARVAKSDFSRNMPAREHSPYAGDETGRPANPGERGDYCDPVKEIVGRGNASHGPWREQGGAGHGENYGAREKSGNPLEKKER
jgi:hypothetical protein